MPLDWRLRSVYHDVVELDFDYSGNAAGVHRLIREVLAGLSKYSSTTKREYIQPRISAYGTGFTIMGLWSASVELTTNYGNGQFVPIGTVPRYRFICGHNRCTPEQFIILLGVANNLLNNYEATRRFVRE